MRSQNPDIISILSLICRRIGMFKTLIFVVFIIDIIGLVLSGIQIRSAYIPLFSYICLITLEFVYTKVRPRPAIASLAGMFADIIGFSCVSAILSYLVVALRFPLVDNSLVMIDNMLHLDWISYYNWYRASPYIITLLMKLSYFSLMIQIISLPILFNFLSLYKSPETVSRSRFLLNGFAATALVSIILSGLFPAVSAFVWYQVELKTAYIADFEGLYNGSKTIIDLSKLQGIITFPSFHAALAVVLTCSTYGIWYLFVPVLLINIINLLSTSVVGGHYFIDIFAGMAIATIWIVIFNVRERRKVKVSDGL